MECQGLIILSDIRHPIRPPIERLHIQPYRLTPGARELEPTTASMVLSSPDSHPPMFNMLHMVRCCARHSALSFRTPQGGLAKTGWRMPAPSYFVRLGARHCTCTRPRRRISSRLGAHPGDLPSFPFGLSLAPARASGQHLNYMQPPQTMTCAAIHRSPPSAKAHGVSKSFDPVASQLLQCRRVRPAFVQIRAWVRPARALIRETIPPATLARDGRGFIRALAGLKTRM